MKKSLQLVLLLGIVATLCHSEETKEVTSSSTTDSSSTTSSKPESTSAKAASSTTQAPKFASSTTPASKPKAKSFPQPKGDRPNVSDDQIEMALKDRRYLQRQLKCTLGEAPCDPVGRRLKTLAPLVLRGSCSQCTQQEMRQVQKVISHIQRNFPKEWAKVVRSYQ